MLCNSIVSRLMLYAKNAIVNRSPLGNDGSIVTNLLLSLPIMTVSATTYSAKEAFPSSSVQFPN